MINELHRNSCHVGQTISCDRSTNELGVDAVIYNTQPGNTAPKQYLDNLSYTEEPVTVVKNDRDRWLETRLGDNASHLYTPINRSDRVNGNDSTPSLTA